jgi:hypothetical protein
MAAFERATVGLFLWWSANAALVDSPARAPSISPFGVAETAQRIASGALSLGLRVFDITDHSGLAARAGFHLRPTQSMLIGAVDAAPLKLVVWEAHNGLTMVSLEGHAAGASPPLGMELSWLRPAQSAAAIALNS